MARKRHNNNRRKRKSFYLHELRRGLERSDGTAGAKEISLQPQIARLLGQLAEAAAERPDDLRSIVRDAEQLARTLTTEHRLNPPPNNPDWDRLVTMITDLVPDFFLADPTTRTPGSTDTGEPLPNQTHQ